MAGNLDVPNSVIPTARAEVNGSTVPMRFPQEHGRFFTILRFVKYRRLNPKRLATSVAQADIVLPLPSNLQEYYNISYGDESFNQTGGAIAASGQLIDMYMDGGGESLESRYQMFNTAAQSSVGWAQALSRGAASAIIPEASSVIDRVQGNVVNPHITSVFKGVGLREHRLSWRLHAKNAKESREIKKIRDFVRERMHPDRKDDFLLNFPDEVYVKFYADGKEFLFPIYKAVVVSINSNLSSDGTNAFFKGTDEPVIVDLEITFKEVEALTRENFTSGGIRGENLPQEVNPTSNETPQRPTDRR